MRLVLCAAALLFAAGCGTAPGSSGSRVITDYGAVGDGRTLDTAAIQKAIDAGPGTVVVPPGTFLSGALELRSNVTLHLEAGAVLKGSPRFDDYLVEGKKRGLVNVHDAGNVSITGEGVLDGSGTSFMDLKTTRTGKHMPGDLDRKCTRQGADYMDAKFGEQDGPVLFLKRPTRMAMFRDCRDVVIRGVTFRDSPAWTVHFAGCAGVIVDRVRMDNNLLYANTDGIHITSSRDVRISNCTILGGDDAIAITGIGGGEGSSGISVRGCVLQSRSSAVRVGFMGADVRDCEFEGLDIRESNRGLLVNVRDGHSVENIVFRDIKIETRLHTGHWWGQGEPIHVSAVRGRRDVEKLGVIRNVRFENIAAVGESGIVVYGAEEGTIRDVTLENVKFEVRNSPLNDAYGGNMDLRMTGDVKLAIFKHDVPGLYARFVENLRVAGFEIKWADGLPEFFTHAVHVERFKNLSIEGLKARQPHEKGVAVMLQDGEGVTVRNCAPAEGTDVPLKHSGVKGLKID